MLGIFKGTLVHRSKKYLQRDSNSQRNNESIDEGVWLVFYTTFSTSHPTRFTPGMINNVINICLLWTLRAINNKRECEIFVFLMLNLHHAHKAEESSLANGGGLTLKSMPVHLCIYLCFFYPVQLRVTA